MATNQTKGEDFELHEMTIGPKERFEFVETLEEKIRRRFIGQEWAVKEVLRRVSRRNAKIGNTNLPIANIFIAGPTGSGKTEFAKVLAGCWPKSVFLKCNLPTCGWEIHEDEVRTRLTEKTLSPVIAEGLQQWLRGDKRRRPMVICPICIGRNGQKKKKTPDGPTGELIPHEQDNLITIDCTQYGGTLEHNLTQLIGSSVGYVGYSDRPVLHPRNLMGGTKVVLWDEFEKGLFDYLGEPTQLGPLLLRIIDEGKLTINSNSGGETTAEVSFSNVINIITSNIGTDEIMKRFKAGEIGFLRGEEKPLSKYTDAELLSLNNAIYKIVKEAVEKRLPPELFNRIAFRGRLIVFRFLRDEEYIEILNRQVLRDVQRQLNQGGMKIRLEYSPEALQLILKETGTDRQFGARPLQALAERWIIDKVCDLINYRKVKSGDVLLVDTRVRPDEDTGEEKEQIIIFRKRIRREGVEVRTQNLTQGKGRDA
ncbi:MAG TPA: AAA family ATPase [Patescibacteria group bacterium]|nr:AAA family ATPase [Patescibacteria group bacterium]